MAFELRYYLVAICFFGTVFVLSWRHLGEILMAFLYYRTLLFIQRATISCHRQYKEHNGYKKTVTVVILLLYGKIIYRIGC